MLGDYLGALQYGGAASTTRTRCPVYFGDADCARVRVRAVNAARGIRAATEHAMLAGAIFG